MMPYSLNDDSIKIKLESITKQSSLSSNNNKLIKEELSTNNTTTAAAAGVKQKNKKLSTNDLINQINQQQVNSLMYSFVTFEGRLIFYIFIIIIIN
jgi:hypothetical protein